MGAYADLCLFAALAAGLVLATAAPAAEAWVALSKPVRDWDGFGVNYVEAAQTRDYRAHPQEYGGFSTLSEADRQKILDMIFGPEGLKPGLLKMFLDCWHQPKPGPKHDRADIRLDPSTYDHETTTKWMRYFATEGLRKTRAWGGDLAIITTLYGPPGWMTRQRFVRGRDLDPQMKYECARYLIAWAEHLRQKHHLPVKYVSLHNEGEARNRWPKDGRGPGGKGHDYNLHWPPGQVVDFLRFMRPMLAAHGLREVGLAPGETTTWELFARRGYAKAIAGDTEALRNLGLVTSHGFGGKTSAGADLLRSERPTLKAWTTSMTWGRMDVAFADDIRQQIYVAQVNGVIPWACIQQAGKWVGGDPNPGTAFRVDGKGGFRVERGYWFYKQLCRAGQPGMKVCQVGSADREVGLIGFAAGGTKNPDAFIVLNLSKRAKALTIRIDGGDSAAFRAFRTSAKEEYEAAGRVAVRHGAVTYQAPPLSVTTFYGRSPGE